MLCVKETHFNWTWTNVMLFCSPLNMPFENLRLFLKLFSSPAIFHSSWTGCYFWLQIVLGDFKESDTRDSCVRDNIEYAALIWSPCYVVHILELEHSQRHFFKYLMCRRMEFIHPLEYKIVHSLIALKLFTS